MTSLVTRGFILSIFLELQPFCYLQAATGDESWDGRFDSPCDGSVYALAVSGSSVYVGGYFNTIGGIQANRIAKWDGNSWSTLGDGFPGNSVVYALAVYNNQLYAGGWFSTAGEQPAQNIARWDGTNWFRVGSNAPTVFTIGVRATNDIFIGHGSPDTNVGPYVARWNGTNWASLGGGVTATTVADPVQSVLVRGNDVFVGGLFTKVGNVTATNLARWDGSQWRAVGGGLDYFGPAQKTRVIASMCTYNSDLYVCGTFNKVGGQTITNLARWNGSAWSAVGSNYWFELDAVAAGPSGVYVGGNINAYIDGFTRGVTKWDGVSWLPLGSGVSGTVKALATTGSDLYVGGFFGLAGGKPSTNFAVWHDTPSLRIERIAQGVRVSWPTQYTGMNLAYSTNVVPANWYNVTQTPGIYSSYYAITNGVAGPRRFFRLQKP